MHNSGTKLVVLLVCLALLLGATSWWYRYVAAHQATQFWGAAASRLIAESESLQAITFEPGRSENLLPLGEIAMTTKSTDLSTARGQVHLRHALLSDRNYVWDVPLNASTIEWRWVLRFHEGEQQAWVQLSDDLAAIGRFDSAAGAVTAFSCQPMTASLKQYFTALGLLAQPQPVASSPSQ